MNYLWAGMIIVGVIYGAFTGRMMDVTNAALDSSKEAVTLCTTMLGVVSFWSGLMEVASKAGILDMASRKMRPLIRFLFPGMPEEHPAAEHITTNFIANFLGLGWAATPAGLRAMEELENLEEERRNKKNMEAVPRGTASKEMCNFLILNISSLQLIPVNIIAYRSQYGSVNPTEIVGPAIVATAINTVVAIVFCKVLDRK